MKRFRHYCSAFAAIFSLFQSVSAHEIVYPCPLDPPAAVIVEPAKERPHREHIAIGFRGLVGISRFSQRSMEAGHDVKYHTTIEMLEPGSKDVFVPSMEGGLVIDVPIFRHFAISTGVFYAQKSNYRKAHKDTTDTKSRECIVSRIGYLKIPCQFTLRNRFAHDQRIDISAGPYVAFGLHGTLRNRYVSDEYDMILQKMQNRIDIFDESIYDNRQGERIAPYKRFDFGFSFTTTYEFRRYCVGANFDLGLTDIAKATHSEGNIRTRSVGVFFGYMFR